MNAEPKKELSVFDSTCIIVGIIIGAGIYETAPTIASAMGTSIGTVLIWLAGGLLALTGAICYSELATAYPNEGGDYIYLKRGYGKIAGFLFGWSQLVIIRPGDIALMSFIFARYATTLYPFAHSSLIYAASAVTILTLINILGVKQGKWTQNFLTVIKALGLLTVIITGLTAPAPSQAVQQTTISSAPGLKLALILVLYTFGGWNEMAYVAAEVKNPQKNIVRALLTGTVAVTVLYIMVNAAFLYSLGYQKMTQSQAVAVDTIASVFPAMAAKAVAVIICISALGAVNGLIFTGSRISYAMGKGHTAFGKLGKWNARLGTPVSSLILQGVISLAIILLIGDFISTILYTATVVWLFFLATGISVFVLRYKDKNTPRPYKAAGYPVTAFIFCATCLFMLYNSASYALANNPTGLYISLAVLLTGGFVYFITEQGNTEINNK